MSNIDPDVDHIVVVERDGSGRRRVVVDMDTGLSERRSKAYEVNVIRRGDDGAMRSVGKSSRKKQARMLRPMEKATRKSARRGVRFMQDYLYLHDRSNQKKKNGWLREYPKNIRKAFRRSFD